MKLRVEQQRGVNANSRKGSHKHHGFTSKHLVADICVPPSAHSSSSWQIPLAAWGCRKNPLCFKVLRADVVTQREQFSCSLTEGHIFYSPGFSGQKHMWKVSLSLSLSTTLLWLKFSKWNEQHSVKPQDLTHFSTLPFYLLTSYDCELWTLFWLVHRHAPSILHFNLLSSVFQVLSFYPFCFFRYFPIHLRNILPSSTALEQTWLSARIHTPSPLLFILCH